MTETVHDITRALVRGVIDEHLGTLDAEKIAREGLVDRLTEILHPGAEVTVPPARPPPLSPGRRTWFQNIKQDLRELFLLEAPPVPTTTPDMEAAILKHGRPLTDFTKEELIGVVEYLLKRISALQEDCDDGKDAV